VLTASLRVLMILKGKKRYLREGLKRRKERKRKKKE
jgi:hypothetical protein